MMTCLGYHYSRTFKCGTRHCDLFLREKYVIAHENHEHILNKKTEIISKCRYRNQYLIRKC